MAATTSAGVRLLLGRSIIPGWLLRFVRDGRGSRGGTALLLPEAASGVGLLALPLVVFALLRGAAGLFFADCWPRFHVTGLSGGS